MGIEIGQSFLDSVYMKEQEKWLKIDGGSEYIFIQMVKIYRCSDHCLAGECKYEPPLVRLALVLNITSVGENM